MMAEVKWIKITTDIFDDEKILLIESLPDSYAIITVWFKLLCLAGKQNNSGVFMMSNKIAYTDKMLATIFRMKESTVAMALNVFSDFAMIEIVDGVITIPNWGKHQSLDQLESKKSYMRDYMRAYREKQKLLTCKTNSKSNVSSADKDVEEDKEETDKEDITYDSPKPTRHKYGLYNNVYLSDADMEKLKTEFSEDWEQRIERLSEYIASTGKSYKNHLATIRAWARKDSQQRTVGANGIAISKKKSDLDGVF